MANHSYAKEKDRAPNVSTANEFVPERKALRKLSEKEEEIIRRRVALVREFAPDFLDMANQLYAMGAIDGLRSIVEFKNLKTGEVV